MHITIFFVEKSSTKPNILRKSAKAGKLYDADTSMAGSESPLKDLIHPEYNEHFKSHNGVTFKLVRIGEYWLFYYVHLKKSFKVVKLLLLTLVKCLTINLYLDAAQLRHVKIKSKMLKNDMII